MPIIKLFSFNKDTSATAATTTTAKRQYLILTFLIIVYLLNGIYSINTWSITADEGSHLSYGIRIIKGDPERNNPEKDNSKMPISVLNAIPRGVEQILSPNLVRNDWGEADTIKGRYVTLLFSVLIIFLVFHWAKRLYGVNAGLFAAFLYCCCPNNLGNAVLVTTDTYAVFFLLATMYFLWRFTQTKSTKHLLWFAMMLGLSQLAKQSLFHLYVLAPLCLIIYAVVQKEKFRFVSLLKKTLIIASISWVIINAGFVFYGMNMKLGDYQFMSSLFQKVQHLFPAQMPVPLSKAFITGLDQAKYYDQLGGGYINSSFGNVTILGHSSTGGSFWYYYFVTIFFKTPITYLILSGWAIFVLCKTSSFKQFIANEFFLLAPIVYFVLLMSFLYNTQVGVRHILFIYPLLFIFSGIIIKHYKGVRDGWLLILLSIFLVFSVAKYCDNYFSYTNEFIADKKAAWKYVGASNLNIDQAYSLMEKYLAKHPDVHLAPEEPAKGKFVLTVDRYLDIWNTGKYQWLRNQEPVGQVAHEFLLFDVK